MSLAFMDNYARIRKQLYAPAPKPIRIPPKPKPVEVKPAPFDEYVAPPAPVVDSYIVPGEPAKNHDVDDDLPIIRKRAAEIIKEVAIEYGVTAADIKGTRRNAYIVEARHKCCFRIRYETSLTFPNIARALGGRDHTTILAGVISYAEKLIQNRHNMRLKGIR